jgi:hypothetical protein
MAKLAQDAVVPIVLRALMFTEPAVYGHQNRLNGSPHFDFHAMYKGDQWAESFVYSKVHASEM